MSSPNILITGSSGFIGGHLVKEALSRGMNVFAAVRASSNKKYLADPRINFVEFDLSAPAQIFKALSTVTNEYGAFQYIIHNAGVTKANNEKDYFNINTYSTQNLLYVITSLGIMPRKFILTSSLAAYGPGNSESLEPIKIEHPPHPITAYGRSKLQAEQILTEQNRIPWLIIRPTAVYGPGEREIFAIFNLINRHIQPVLKNKKQRLSFIYVKDLVRAIIDLTLSQHANRSYFVSDGNSYDNKVFGNFVKTHLGKRTLKVPVSAGTLAAIAHTLEGVYSFTKKSPGLNVEKAQEMNSINWICDIQPLKEDIGFIPEYNLEKGIKETLEWYTQAGWL